MKDFVDNVDAEPRDRGLRLRMVAEKLVDFTERLRKRDQAALAAKGIELAESLFRSFAEKTPVRNWCWRRSWDNTARSTKR